MKKVNIFLKLCFRNFLKNGLKYFLVNSLHFYLPISSISSELKSFIFYILYKSILSQVYVLENTKCFSVNVRMTGRLN